MSSAAAHMPNPMFRVLALSDFRYLFTGTALSLLGDQFALIATPWLVLQLSGDPMVLGAVLAAAGLPRAVFMLLGGAASDRLSPRRIMLIADMLRLVLVAVLAITVITGMVEIWMVFAFSLAFGTVAGFAVPAENAIVPMIVGKDDLQGGNALIMGVGQLAGFAGPSLAGILIGLYAEGLGGVALAFGVDALSFGVSALCLYLIRGARPVAAPEGGHEGIFAAIRTALVYVWEDGALRLVFLILAAINFLLIGPLLIGIPLIASTRLPEGAMAFGMLMSAFAAGNLVGFVLAGALPRPDATVMRCLLIALLIAFGAVVGGLGFVPWTGLDAALLMLLGLGNGYIAILLFTWMQTRTPRHMLGRVMGFLMLANTGLVPLSQALAGAIGKWDLDAMLLVAGGLAILISAWAATRPELDRFSHDLAETSSSLPQGA